MRAAVETWLLQTWYGARRPPWYLRMLEPVYRRGFRYSQKRQSRAARGCRPPKPLVVVGNITAGGSGKTPLVIHLCRIAQEMNLKPGVASTGYGRSDRETRLVQADSDVRLCGDEPVMMAARTGVPVVVAADRLDAVRQLGEMDVDLVISDDGLQRPGLCADIEICIIDGQRGLGNGHLLPAGPLRETAGRLAQVDFLVSNGRWEEAPEELDVHVMQLRADFVHTLDQSSTLPVNEFMQRFAGTDIHAVAGIGNPRRFFSLLEDLGLQPVTHGFPDHHRFTRADFTPEMTATAVVMTEKDAVKCRSLGLDNGWYVPVETHLDENLEIAIRQRFSRLMEDRE